MHGVHKIPLEIAAKLSEAARKERERAFDFIDFYRSPDFTIGKMRERLGG